MYCHNNLIGRGGKREEGEKAGISECEINVNKG